MAIPENKISMTADRYFFGRTFGAEISYFRKGKLSLKLLEDNTASAYIGLRLYGLPWDEEISKQLLDIAPTGLYLSPYDPFRNISTENLQKDEPIPAMVLTMDHLAIGFEIIGIFYLISLFSFSVEILIPKLKSFCAQTRDLIVFLYVLNRFLMIKNLIL